MPLPEIEHIETCPECRGFTREMMKEDREELMLRFRETIREEWQVTVNIKERVTRIEKIISWLIISQAIQGLAIITIVYFLIKMHV